MRKELKAAIDLAAYCGLYVYTHNPGDGKKYVVSYESDSCYHACRGERYYGRGEEAKLLEYLIGYAEGTRPSRKEKGRNS